MDKDKLKVLARTVNTDVGKLWMAVNAFEENCTANVNMNADNGHLLAKSKKKRQR